MHRFVGLGQNTHIKKISFGLLTIGIKRVRLRRDSPMQKRNYLDSFSAGRYAEQE
jgi:hypothetical protein